MGALEIVPEDVRLFEIFFDHGKGSVRGSAGRPPSPPVPGRSRMALRAEGGFVWFVAPDHKHAGLTVARVTLASWLAFQDNAKVVGHVFAGVDLTPGVIWPTPMEGAPPFAPRASTLARWYCDPCREAVRSEAERPHPCPECQARKLPQES